MKLIFFIFLILFFYWYNIVFMCSSQREKTKQINVDYEIKLPK